MGRGRTIRCAVVGSLVAGLLMVGPTSAAAQAEPESLPAWQTLPWERHVIYSIRPSNFFDTGVQSTGPTACEAGDLAGIRQQIPFIKTLGANTVMLWPVFDMDDAPDAFGYMNCGFRIEDHQTIDPHYGTMADYADVLRLLHSTTNGIPIRLMQDLPFSALGWEHPWVTPASNRPGHIRPFNHTDLYDNVFSSCQVDQQPEPPCVRHDMASAQWDGASGALVADHVNNVAALRQQVIDPLLRLDTGPGGGVDGIDGYRYDSGQNFDIDFFRQVLPQLRAAFGPNATNGRNVIQFVEYFPSLPHLTFQGASAGTYLQPSGGQPMFDGMYDLGWNLQPGQTALIRRVFGRGEPAGLLEDGHTAAANAFVQLGIPGRERGLVATIDGLEDQPGNPRSFLALPRDAGYTATDDERSKGAMTYLLTIDRVPLLYTGNEYGIDHDEVGELFGPAVAAPERQSFFTFVQALIDLRQSERALTSGPTTWLVSNQSDLLAFARTSAPGRTDTGFVVTQNLRPHAGETAFVLNGLLGQPCAAAPASPTPDVPTGTLGEHGLVVSSSRATALSTVTTCEPVPVHPFSDAQGSYNQRFVSWGLDQALFTGYGDNTFRPGEGILRRDAVNWLYKLAGSPPQPGTCEPIADVHNSDYYCKAVKWALAQGIVVPTSSPATFDPGDELTRASGALWLYRASRANGLPPVCPGPPSCRVSVPTFDDVASTHNAYAAIRWLTYVPTSPMEAVGAGTDATHFAPSTAATRSNWLQWLYRYEAQPERFRGANAL